MLDGKEVAGGLERIRTGHYSKGQAPWESPLEGKKVIVGLAKTSANLTLAVPKGVREALGSPVSFTRTGRIMRVSHNKRSGSVALSKQAKSTDWPHRATKSANLLGLDVPLHFNQVEILAKYVRRDGELGLEFELPSMVKVPDELVTEHPYYSMSIEELMGDLRDRIAVVQERFPTGSFYFDEEGVLRIKVLTENVV